MVMTTSSLAVHTRGFHAIVELLDEPWQFLYLLQDVKVSHYSQERMRGKDIRLRI